MFRSIRWTLQLWHGGILAVALVLLSGAFDAGLKRAQMRRVDAELESAARVLVSGPIGPPRDGRREGRPPPFPTIGPQESASGAAAGNFDEGSAGRDPGGARGEGRPRFSPPADWWNDVPRNALRRLGEREQDQPYFIIWGYDGTVLRASAPELQAPPVDERPPIAETFATMSAPRFRQHGEFREVILGGPFGIGVLVGKSMRAENATIASLRLQFAGAGVAVLAIGLCGGWLLSRRAIRPIETISAAARSISASDLSRRITVEETSSELGSLAQTLNATFERLETAFERQVRFTADASHELRTPLAVIHSHAELALAKERSGAEYRHTIETTLKAARRMRSLVEALLALARADAHQLSLRRERFDLAELAEECVAAAAIRAQEKKVTIETKLAPVEIASDRGHVAQLLTNLLSNAIQYNRPGGRVTLTIAAVGDDAVASIADTGLGIAPEDQPRIFERFFRADKARSAEAGGVGLGLAICQGLATALGGSISFTSQLGEGTTFTIRLPLGTVALPRIPT